MLRARRRVAGVDLPELGRVPDDRLSDGVGDIVGNAFANHDIGGRLDGLGLALGLLGGMAASI